MLLMIGAEAAVVRAAVFNGCIELQRHVRWLNKAIALLVVLHVVGNEHFFASVNEAVLYQVHLVISKDDLALYFAQTGGAHAVCKRIEQVGACRHVSHLSKHFSIAAATGASG